MNIINLDEKRRAKIKMKNENKKHKYINDLIKVISSLNKEVRL